MISSIPTQVKSTFDSFRKHGTLGPAAEKTGPESELLLFTTLRDTFEDVATFDKLDNVPGKDLNNSQGKIELSPQALADLGKPYKTLTAESYEGDSNAILLHKSADDRQSFELITNDAQGPAVVTATQVGSDTWNFGSKRLLMENGQPVMGEFGMPRCVGEMLIAK